MANVVANFVAFEVQRLEWSSLGAVTCTLEVEADRAMHAGVGFAGKFMNQGGALVHIYIDGTVLVTTGGIEMGQGLHTKCCMVLPALGLPPPPPPPPFQGQASSPRASERIEIFHVLFTQGYLVSRQASSPLCIALHLFVTGGMVLVSVILVDLQHLQLAASGMTMHAVGLEWT